MCPVGAARRTLVTFLIDVARIRGGGIDSAAMVRDSRTLATLIAVTAAACGGGNVASQLRPDAPTAGAARGEAACKPTAGDASPLVVDLKAEQRLDIEAAMREGVPVVQYSCDGIRVLGDCRLD